MLTTRWRKGEPMLSLGTPSGRVTFPTLVAAGQRLGTRTDTAATVYAGDGAAADYQGRRRPGQDRRRRAQRRVTPEERPRRPRPPVRSALIVVNDGTGASTSTSASRRSRSPASTAMPGAALVALAKERQASSPLKQTAYTPFVYDLTREYPGHVPDQPLVYHPTKSDLAKIDAHYYAVRPGRPGGYRYDVTLSPRRSAATSSSGPGHPRRVGHARPAVGRVARPAHRRRAALAHGLGGQHLPPGEDRSCSTGSGPPCGPGSATRSGSTTPAGRTT